MYRTPWRGGVKAILSRQQSRRIPILTVCASFLSCVSSDPAPPDFSRNRESDFFRLCFFASYSSLVLDCPSWVNPRHLVRQESLSIAHLGKDHFACYQFVLW